MKVNYDEMSKQIIEYAGGEANIKKVSHCFTRLRLDLVELEKCDTEGMKKIDGTKGCVVNAGQVQVIIGNEVEDLFPVFQKYLDASKVDGEVIEENPEPQKRTVKSVANSLLNGLAQIFTPVFPALAASGLIRAVLTLCNYMGWLDSTGETYTVIMYFASAVFYYLPVFIAMSSAKVFGCKPVLAALLACIMLYPDYMALEESTSLFGLTVPVVDYSSTVFPVIAGVWILSVIEKFCRKHIPKTFSGLLTPMISIMITAPIMLIVVGPAVDTLSDSFANIFISLYETTGALGGAVFGAVYPFLVFTGLHHAVVPVELAAIAETGFDPFLGMCAAANAAVGGACLMVAIDSKNAEMKSLATSSGITALLGTTEPGLYGVLGILKRPFIGAAAGGAAGAAICALFKVTATGLGPVPVAGFAMFLTDTFVYFVIAMIVSVVVSMVVTHVVKFEDVEIKG